MDNSENKPFVQDKNGLKLRIKVIPGSSKCEICGIIGNEIKIKLDVPPVEGKANEKCIKFLAKELGVPKSAISIISGQKARSKILFINSNNSDLIKKLYPFQ